jgi:hypothetical protein
MKTLMFAVLVSLCACEKESEKCAREAYEETARVCIKESKDFPTDADGKPRDPEACMRARAKGAALYIKAVCPK